MSDPRSPPTNSLTHQPTTSTQLLITSRRGPHRKHHFSIAVCGPLSSCLFRGRCLGTGVRATILRHEPSGVLTINLEVLYFQGCITRIYQVT
jgi:hypothetical protein